MCLLDQLQWGMRASLIDVVAMVPYGKAWNAVILMLLRCP